MTALATALVAVLAFSGTAAAQTDHLRYRTAKKLALKLAQKQSRGRDVVSNHVRNPERLTRNAIAFAYDDRTTNEVFCTAVLIVTQREIRNGVRIRARFRGQRCDKIPEDALAVEAATRATRRALRDTADETLASLRRLTWSLRRCEDLDVPRDRRAHTRAVFDVALVQALFQPNEVVLLDFVTDLEQIETSNQVLRRGIGAWIDWFLAVEALPEFEDPCATLRTWAASDWDASESPIDLEAYREISTRAAADERVIRRTARYLRDVGVFRRLARRFTLEGAIGARALVDAPGTPSPPGKLALP